MAHSGKAPMPEILPGTYPGEAPPGLEATIQAAQAEQETQQPIRQRNRLHKAATPRSHTYDEPGAAATDTEPLLHASKPAEPILTSSNEPGSSDYTWDSSTPRAPLESIRSELHTATPEPQVQDEGSAPDMQKTVPSRGQKMAGPATIGGMAATGSQKMDTPGRTTKSSTTSDPYWGDLGKGRETEAEQMTTSPVGAGYSGIEPQTRISQQSESSEKPTTTGADNAPSGGVYNTVIGHGSQDNETSRPMQSTTSRIGGTQTAATNPSDDDAMLAVPLDDIPEEKGKTRKTPSTDTRSGASSFTRDDPRREDMMTSKPASRDVAREESPPKINMASRPAANVETTRQESHHRPRQSSSPSRYWRSEEVAAGRKQDISEPIGKPSAEHQTMGPSQSPGQHAGHQPTTMAPSSPAEKVAARDDDSIKGEKRHSFLSMFHRHKREEPAKETTAATHQPERLHKPSSEEPSSEDKPWSPIVEDMDYIDDHSGPGMKKAAAWEAAGVAGVMGMLHRGKTVSGGSSEKRKSSISHPISPRTGAPDVEAKGTREEGVSNPFEHPREPPSPPTRREHGTFGPASLTAPQIPKRASTTKEHATYDKQPVMAVPDPDITRGDVASREYTKYNTFSTPHNTAAPEQGMTPSQTGEYRGTSSTHTQASIHTTRGMTAPETGYQAPSSIMTAGSATAGHPEHKHLPHHAHFTPTSEDTEQSQQRAPGSHEPHPFLAAPIPSHSHGTRPNPSQESVPGVTTYPQPPAEHTMTPDSYTAPPPREHRQEREGATSQPMAPGAAAAYSPTTGLSPPPAHSQVHSAQYPSHAKMTQETSREAPKPETYMGPLPLPLKVHKQGAPTSPTTEPAQHTLHYPASPQSAKGMSPEVMPDAYTASSPRREHAPMAAASAIPLATSQKGYTTTHTVPEHDMSPEVMPEAYTASAMPPKEPETAEPSGLGIGTSMAAIGSGLAAAMGFGKSSYNADDRRVDTKMGMGHQGMGMPQEMGMHVGKATGSTGRTMYKCVHCGCENDISGVLDRAREEWKAVEGARY